MNILVDMNLSPGWCGVLRAAGHSAVHWSEVGNIKAPDRELMDWAASRSHIVFTHDIGFGSLLAAHGASRPSVIQVRTAGVLPQDIAELVIAALREFESLLLGGAIVVIEPSRSRARVLPLR